MISSTSLTATSIAFAMLAAVYGCSGSDGSSIVAGATTGTPSAALPAPSAPANEDQPGTFIPNSIAPPDGGVPTDAGPDPIDAAPDAAISAISFYPARAIIAGSGCAGSSASAALDGFGFVVSFSEMKIDLRDAGALSDRKACSIRVPFDIPTGYYVQRLEQKLDYSLARTGGAHATLSTSAGLFDMNASPYTVAHDSAGDETLPSASMHNTVTFASGSPEATAMCGPRPTGGLLKINIAMTAERTASQSVAVTVQKFDFHEGVDVFLARCP